MRRQGTAGQKIHFERSHETLPIARVNPNSRFRIHATEQRVKPFGPLAIGNSFQSTAKRNVTRGAGKEPSGQGTIVETSSADNDRKLPACGDVTDCCAGFTRV